MSVKRVSAVLFLLGCSTWAQTKREIDIKGGAVWTDTNIDVRAGDTIRITATGSLQYADAAQACDPGGLPRGWKDLLRQFPYNDAGRGALVGRIGDSDAARPFLIGPRTERPAPVSGRLYLGLNQGSNDRPDGSFHVVIETVARPKTAAAAVSKSVAPFPQALLDRIPNRVVDAQGNEGDRVNFILIGSERTVQAAFAAAGWVTVDKTNKDAIVRGLLSSLSKQAYVTLPMSELMLFGRVQDYAYAQGDPVRVVASRHHFRIWKAPFTLAGQTVWAGAGTHDIGFDRDQRNNGITHKIDPDTDKEREYIGESLQQTGMVAKLSYATFTNAVKEAKTATGESFQSDGRTLLIYLQGDGDTDHTTRFSDLFCSVLSQGNPDGGEWGSCDQYIDGKGRTDLKLGPISTKYRVAIVPGLMSSCFSDAPAFLEGQTALRDKYGMAVDLVPVPNDASEDNAKVIAKSLRDLARSDPRKFILVGYSKGAPDLQVALAKEDGVAALSAAVVSVAGAVGGSPIADVLPKIAEKYVNQYQLQGCKGDLAAGFRSLKSEVRNAFLASYPRPPVPAYSVVARSDKARTSKSLLETWQLLTSYGSVQDGQLLRDDALYPDAKYLGAALADHFAIALPFEKSNSPMKAAMDKNRYPRAALLEAIVRFVTADLDGAEQARR
jgi:hypothetical protein